MFRLNEPKYVAEFLIFLVLITNICCVIDEINLLYYRNTQRDGSYQVHPFYMLTVIHCLNSEAHNPLTIYAVPCE